MIEKKIFAQKEDIDVVMTVLKKDGAALDMSTAVKIYVIIHDGYNTVVAKFKNGVATTGWYAMDTTNAATGILAFSILSEVTELLKEGMHYAEILVRYNSGAHPDDSLYDLPVPKQYLFTIVESQINKIGALP